MKLDRLNEYLNKLQNDKATVLELGGVMMSNDKLIKVIAEFLEPV